MAQGNAHVCFPLKGGIITVLNSEVFLPLRSFLGEYVDVNLWVFFFPLYLSHLMLLRSYKRNTERTTRWRWQTVLNSPEYYLYCTVFLFQFPLFLTLSCEKKK